MRFSLLIEAQLPRPTPEREQQLFAEIVEQAILADELGYHCLWAVEHHGLAEYSHCSAPETLLAYLAGRTSRIRLGHSVMLSPGAYNHPIRVAERVATLDVLSGGRVSWGSGKSATKTEQGAFQLDPATLHEQWLEALEMVPRMWRSDVFEHDGKHWTIPPTPIIPKPVQQPTPPLYMACSRPESIVLAGELGVGSLNFAAGPQEQLQEAVARYRHAIAGSAVPPRRITEEFCVTPAALVLPDDREACELGFRGARYHAEGLASYFFSPVRQVGAPELSTAPLTPEELERAMASRRAPGSALNTVIGDPAAALEAVRRFADCGVDELILVMQMGGVPHEAVMRSLRTFAEEVMPSA